jgi:hypothetical protein
MTSREFCYWLQGYFELDASNAPLNAIQTEAVKKHLAMVFKHEIDPSLGSPEHQAELRKVHEGGSSLPGLPFDLNNTKMMC